jgi:hypothetical protein
VRLTLACAFGIGYVLGSKAGRERYEQIRELGRGAAEGVSRSGVRERLGDYGARLESYAQRARTAA